MTSITAGRVGDFEDGVPRVIRAEGREIGVVRWRGQFFAIRNVCPHEGAGLCQGTVRALLQAPEVGRLEADERHPVVTCPWHGWEFDLHTGQSVYGDPRCRVRSYPTRLDGDTVLVDC